jgi:murein DD-endopeptidase MepM/ murein hydrolase activator NlpD
MAFGGMPGRFVRAITVRRRAITLISLTVVAYALPAHAEPARDRPPVAGGTTAPESQQLDVIADADHVYYGGARPMRVTYVINGSEPMTVTVDAVRSRDGVTVAHWDQGIVAPGTALVTWDGTSDGRIQPEGLYLFRVTATPVSGGPTQVGGASIRFLRHRYPVRGAHGYGDSGARFGAGRGFGGHQGQDVFADCGTPLVAARGGKVQYRGFHGRAGNYLVIDGAGTDVDYVYAHMREPARFGVGRRVFTGQLIGHVGRTGDATACHLHFEMWSGPGWYAGGAPFDPLALLRAWDRVS